MRELISTRAERFTDSVDLCEDSTLAAAWEDQNEHTSSNGIDFLLHIYMHMPFTKSKKSIKTTILCHILESPYHRHVQRRNRSDGNPTVTLGDSENHLLESL